MNRRHLMLSVVGAAAGAATAKLEVSTDLHLKSNTRWFLPQNAAPWAWRFTEQQIVEARVSLPLGVVHSRLDLITFYGEEPDGGMLSARVRLLAQLRARYRHPFMSEFADYERCTLTVVVEEHEDAMRRASAQQGITLRRPSHDAPLTEGSLEQALVDIRRYAVDQGQVLSIRPTKFYPSI